jgi:hypothetical protein
MFVVYIWNISNNFNRLTLEGELLSVRKKQSALYLVLRRWFSIQFHVRRLNPDGKEYTPPDYHCCQFMALSFAVQP